MSTIDEVLAAAEVVDAVCVIDGETRIISVPAEYKELGVESDEKVTRVKFQCPKIVGDNIDLTEYNLYINYRNAGNKLNSYLVEDVTVTGDTINFSWLLSRHVTESPGTISYIVCAKKSDDTGVINEWNTKVATGIVGIGLEAAEEIEEQNIDAIEQILRSIVELENNIGSGGSGGSGEDGGYYSPSVDADGNLTWTPSKADMPVADGANIKGPQGKSAYQYAQEGGYTGTEAEFAAKLAEEMPDKLPNPNTLTFTGAVTGTYDGSAAVSVEIPAGGGGSGDITDVLMDVTIEEAVAAVTVTLDTPRAYKELYIATCVYGDESNSSANAMFLRVNNTDTMNSKNVIAWIPSVENATSATVKSYGVAFVKLLDDCSFYYCYGSKSSNARTPQSSYGEKYTVFNKETIISTLKFQSVNQWTNFGVGSTIKVYGVRS